MLIAAVDQPLHAIKQHTHIVISMGTHMKTTIEISDALFASAKRFAQQRQTTMRALVEDGLRRVLNDSKAQIKHWKRRVGVVECGS